VSIQDQLQDDLKTALRQRDEQRKSTLRMALAALKNARVEKNADLTEEEVVIVLRREVAQYRDAMAEYEKGRRPDLVAEAAAAIAIMEGYLPDMLDREAIVEMAREVIVEVGAANPKQMGQVMRVLMPRIQGQADGRMVSEVVRELLADTS
jgi:uncharacterized protein YqeY